MGKQTWDCPTASISPAAASFCWDTCQHARLSCCKTSCDTDSNMQPSAKCPQLATAHPLSLQMLFLSSSLPLLISSTPHPFLSPPLLIPSSRLSFCPSYAFRLVSQQISLLFPQKSHVLRTSAWKSGESFQRRAERRGLGSQEVR